jgi:hypothetical protein
MGYVFFLHERGGGCGPIRIGETDACPYHRLTQLRSIKRKSERYRHYELLGVIDVPDDQQSHLVKRKIQNDFETLRTNGDWFQPGLQLVAFIKENARPYFCSTGCPDGTSIWEEHLAMQQAVNEKAQAAFGSTTEPQDSM